MLKNIFKISILLSLGFLFILGCAKTKNIDDLLLHFESQGLSIEDPPALSTDEKRVVEGAKKMFAAAGIKGGKNIESKIKVVESIKIRILKYPSSTAAEKAYKFFAQGEERRKKDSIARNYPYSRTDHFINGKFILQIDYYRVKLVSGGIGADKIKIDEAVLLKIKQAFESFGK